MQTERVACVCRTNTHIHMLIYGYNRIVCTNTITLLNMVMLGSVSPGRTRARVCLRVIALPMFVYAWRSESFVRP